MIPAGNVPGGGGGGGGNSAADDPQRGGGQSRFSMLWLVETGKGLTGVAITSTGCADAWKLK